MVNDFAFDMATFTSGDADDIATAIASFYNTVQVIPGTDRSVAEYISSSMSRVANAATIQMYNLAGFLDGSPHGSPTFVRSFTLGASGITTAFFPQEVSGVLSFHADLDGVLEQSGNTRPAARRRGRIYIGPLMSLANSSSVSGVVFLNQELMDCFKAAATFLQGALNNAWSVWSRAEATLFPVVAGWIDNTYDTQRRRGVAYSLRTLWP